MARRTTLITLSDSADITTVDNNFQTIENYLVCDYVESDLATLKTNHPASANNFNKKCKINSDNTIYKCKLVGGNYSWEKDYENGIIYATYAELKALKNAKGLVAGQKYRITDYVTTVNSGFTEYKSAGHQFDLIVEALDNATFSEDAKAIQHEGDTYFANSKLEKWHIVYRFNNEGWSNTANGKGYITMLEDEKGNIFPYDFKNIMRKVYKITANTKQTDYVGQYGAIQTGAITNTTFLNSTFSLTDYKYCYTFNLTTDNYATCTDGSVSGVNCNGNDFASMIDKRSDALIMNIFLSTQVHNIRGNKCSGESCNIVFLCSGSNDCNSNSFGNNCSSNSFGNSCSYNSFGNSCNSNSFGNNCSYNSFGNSCNSNSFGNNCSSNSFGNNCFNNSFGNNCSSNSFGNNCYNNSFGNKYTNNKIGNRMWNCTFNCLDTKGNGGINYNFFENNVMYCKWTIGDAALDNYVGSGARVDVTIGDSERFFNNKVEGFEMWDETASQTSRIIFNTTGGINNTYITKGCSALTITASNIKVLATKTNTTYSTAGQVITS